MDGNNRGGDLSRVCTVLSHGVTMQQDPSLTDDAELPEINWSDELVQHAVWLRKVIYIRLGEVAGVEEVFQELAVAALRQKAPIRDPSRVAPWLYRLAVNLSLLYRRKLGRHRKLMERYTFHKESDTTGPYEDPFQWLVREERRKQVREALSQLPPRDSEILLLKHTQNWSYRQIAEHLDITESAVETRLHRARKRLAAILSRMEKGLFPKNSEKKSENEQDVFEDGNISEESDF